MWDIKDVHEILDAIQFAIKYYDISDAKSTLTVRLMNGKHEKVEASADRIKNKRYEIRLARAQIDTTLEAVLLALFHEMTHVKQFIKDGFINQVPYIWKNKRASLDQDYWLSPWEMEARAMERALIAEYEKHR